MSNKIELSLVAAWFIFSLSGQSMVEEARLVSSQPYQTPQECVAVARLLQGASLAPFFYCVGSRTVSELPPLVNQQFRLSIEPPKGRQAGGK